MEPSANGFSIDMRLASCLTTITRLARLLGIIAIPLTHAGCGSLGQKLTFVRPPISASVAHVEILKSLRIDLFMYDQDLGVFPMQSR